MMKLTAILALVLCLILVVFAFASCDKKNKKTGTTAAPTTAAPASATNPINRKKPALREPAFSI